MQLTKAERIINFGSERLRRHSMHVITALLVLVIFAVVTLTFVNNNRLGAILQESIESDLLSTCNIARDYIDIDLFLSINSEQDIYNQRDAYSAVLSKLRKLREEVGATYIYALKEIDGAYYFIFDTDSVFDSPGDPIFFAYQLSPVHQEAFAGNPSAGIMNVTDEWGSYNTGAIPLYHDGRVVGIICTDIEDAYVARSQMNGMIGTVLLVAIVIITLATMYGFLLAFMRKNRKMEDHLYRVSNHDSVTGLLNRSFFFSFFATWSRTHKPSDTAFGLLFIDLDNFKSVNDKAGHDTGDILLREIADFFRAHTDSATNPGGIPGIVARIGGDEFLLVFPNATTPEELENCAEVMLEDFANQEGLQTFVRDFNIGLSIGGALFPSQANDYDELVKLADIAMYISKYKGKNCYTLYNESMGEGDETMVLTVRTNKKRGLVVPEIPTSEESEGSEENEKTETPEKPEKPGRKEKKVQS